MKSEVPILFFKLLSSPKPVSNGTIKISAPDPISPPKIPTIEPTSVKPNILFITISVYKNNS